MTARRPGERTNMGFGPTMGRALLSAKRFIESGGAPTQPRFARGAFRSSVAVEKHSAVEVRRRRRAATAIRVLNWSGR